MLENPPRLNPLMSYPRIAKADMPWQRTAPPLTCNADGPAIANHTARTDTHTSAELPSDNPYAKVPVKPMPATSCVSNTFLSPPVFVEAARSATTDEQPGNADDVRRPPPMPPAAASESTTDKTESENNCAKPRS